MSGPYGTIAERPTQSLRGGTGSYRPARRLGPSTPSADGDWPVSKPRAWTALARVDRAVGLSSLLGGARGAVLVYHSVGGVSGADYPWDLTREQFREQIQMLTESFEVVDLPAVVEPLGGNRAAVTFDDGFRNFAEVAAPVLREFDVPATVFVSPAFVGDANADLLRERHGLDAGARDVVMTEEQVRAIADDDLFTVGNHTATHPDLATVDDREELADEVVGGKERLESRFGLDVDRFSFPYGSIDERALDVVRDSHDLAVTTEQSPVRSRHGPFRIPRLEACQPFATLRFEMTDVGDRVKRLARSVTTGVR